MTAAALATRPAPATADAVRRRLHRVVAGTVVAGAAATTTAWHLTDGVPAPARSRPWLVLALLALACLGEIGYVRVRHGDSTEDLTLYESVVVVTVCLLPPRTALVVPIIAVALASALMRRSVVKTVFNVGSYALGTSTLVVVYAAGGAAGRPFSVAWLVALVLGTAGFAVVNLVALARVLGVVQARPVSSVLREEWRLSAFIAVGSVGLGGVAVVVAQMAPVLLPFTALPALALTYAYRAAAREADEQQRSKCLLDLGEALATRTAPAELVAVAADSLKRMFGADLVQISAPGAGSEALPVPDGTAPQDVPADQLPRGWRKAVVAAADGGEPLVVVLAWLAARTQSGSRPWRRDRTLTSSDRAVFASVLNTLSAALRAAAHLAALTEESSKLKAVVEQAAEGIVVADGTGEVLLWSPALAAMSGVDAQGLTVAEAARLLDVRTVDFPVPTPSSPTVEHDVVVTRPDGDRRDVRIGATATFDGTGDLHRVVAIVRDVTSERRTERMKADFVATVSHELRTPITPIKGYARLLAAQGDKMPADRRRKALALIEERADHLARLVEDLLLSSRVSGENSAALNVELEDVDLRQLATKSATAMTPLAGRLRVDVPPTAVDVRCDPGRVVQCLTNLLSNAEKYSEPSTLVHLTVHPPVVGDQAALVSVADAGYGIPQDQLDRVFDRFHRVEDALTARSGGSGLGLFIARELARAMGGDLTVESTLGHGSTFTLNVPLASTHDTARTARTQLEGAVL